MSIPKPSLYYHLYGNLNEQYYNHIFVIVVLRTLYNSQNIYFEIIVSHQYICITYYCNYLLLTIIWSYLNICTLFSLSLSLSLSLSFVNNRNILIEYFISIFIPS